MNFLALALSLLQTVLAAAQKGQAEQQIITTLQSALAEIAKVAGTDVEFQQLEDLRTKATW